MFTWYDECSDGFEMCLSTLALRAEVYSRARLKLDGRIIVQFRRRGGRQRQRGDLGLEVHSGGCQEQEPFFKSMWRL